MMAKALNILVLAGAAALFSMGVSALAAESNTGQKPPAEPSPRVKKILEERCQLCHGFHGEASNAIYPRLAAQNRAYLEKQLRLFRSGVRKSDIMNEQAAKLTDEEIRDLAAWFSAQPPLSHRVPRTPKKKLLLKMGEYYFRYGDQFIDIPACRECHGEDARGSETLPRLAGQHRKYIVNQLKAFKSGERKTDDAIMQHIAKNLPRLAMESIALFLSTLQPEGSSTDGNQN